MNILLTAVNSKYIHSNLAVYSLKAYHDERSDYKDSVCIAEFTINQLQDDIIREIYLKRPDVVAFSCYIWNIEYIYDISLELKKILPDTDIWLGGPEVTYDSERVLKEHPYIRGVMSGEGEQTFLEVCDAYCSLHDDLNDTLSQIKQISVNINGEIITTPARQLLDMDELPFVYKDKLDEFKNKIIYYESSRGCPFGCSYCLSSVEKSVRFRSLSLVFEELKYFLDAKVAQVKFVDRTFNCNHDRTIKLLQFIKDNDNNVTNFHFEIAADLLKDDEIEIMREMRTGLIQLEIGVQSSNAVTIKEIDRVMNLEKLSDIVLKIDSAHNVHQHLDLIAGLPYEDIISFRKSFDYVYNLHPEQLQLGFLKVLKGSKMYRMAKEYGIVYKDKPTYEVLYTKWLSYDDVLHLKQIEEMVEVYYNSRQYVNTMNLLYTYFDSAYEMYEKLAKYYDANGYFSVKHSRIEQYNILLDFIKETLAKPETSGMHETHVSLRDNKADMAKFKQVLLYDLYLRENLKTRPKFACDVSEMKKDIKKLYMLCKADKSTHLEPFDDDMGAFLNIENEITVSENELENVSGEFTGKHWILFDYNNKSALDNSAFVYKVNIVEG